ncbi:MAG: ubiquinone/menaquinone biosynthesis methyltransferase [Candidatus Hodarchaeota archaeon]
MLDKSPRTIIGMFNSIANQYDLMNDLMTIFSHRRTRKIATQLSDFVPSKRALDLATGTGNFTFLLFKEGQGTIIGTDMSDKMLSIALNKSQRLGTNEHISFTFSDIDHLPFSDEIFDVCTIGYGIRNVPDPLNTMKEVARVTKKGRRFIIVEVTSPTKYQVKFLVLFYIRKLVPLIAKILSVNASAYTYLADSISQFPKAIEFSKIIKQAGWKKVFWYPLYFETVTIFLAIK